MKLKALLFGDCQINSWKYVFSILQNIVEYVNWFAKENKKLHKTQKPTYSKPNCQQSHMSDGSLYVAYHIVYVQGHSQFC